MLQDESLIAAGAAITEEKTLALKEDTNDRFLDGPTSRRIGTVDFDPDTGAPLGPPAQYTTPNPRNPASGRFEADQAQPASPAFIAANAYGTVFETIRMFEEKEALGRQVQWAFPGEQLLIVPRAGEWANAVYDRDTRSLQFYWFESDGYGRVYTALSRDIVAHECGHALLDAVVPSLHDAATPESLAIHEGIADLVAVLMALRSPQLRNRVLAKTNYSIADATAFSSIAERFGQAQPQPDQMPQQALRNLMNNNTMSSVDRSDPHPLSTVLSGLFYATLVDVFDGATRNNSSDAPGRPAMPLPQAASKALGSAEVIFRRLLLRGIDYLPPGELTFADVGRATIAADAAADTEGERRASSRQRIAQRFVDREIVDSIDDLDVKTPSELSIAPERLPDIRDSDWAAYSFVNDNRSRFGIPDGVNFKVLPRVDATKATGVRGADGRYDTKQRELILKVGWDTIEDNDVAALAAPKRRVQTGATLALRWSDGAVLALVNSTVTSDPAQRAGRDAFLTRLFSSDIPVRIVDAQNPARMPGTAAGIEVRVVEDAAKFSGTQRLLHLQPLQGMATVPGEENG